MKTQISFGVQLLCAFYAVSYLLNKFAGLSAVKYSFIYIFSFIGIYFIMKHGLSHKGTFIGNKSLYVLALFLSFTIVTGIYFDNSLPFESMAVKDFANYVICTISFTPLCKTLFLLLFEYIYKCSCSDMDRTGDTSCSLKIFLASYAIMFGCWMIVWLAYYPGLWNYDVYQVEQFISGNYNKHHPLIHTILLGLCYSKGLQMGLPNMGVIVYDLMQMMVMAGIFAYTYVYIYKQISGKIFRIAVLAFYAVFPVNSILVISSTKDIIFSGLVLLCVVLTLKINETDFKRKKYLSAILLMITCTFMLLFRNNAIYAFCLFIIGICVLGVYSKNLHFAGILIYCICCVMMFTVSDAALTHWLDAKPGPFKEMFSVPSQQFGRIYNTINESGSDPVNLELINSYHDMSPTTYNPHLADFTKDTLLVTNREEAIEYIKDSVRLFYKYPLVSLDSFLYLTEGCWNINDVSNAYMYGSGSATRNGYLLTGVKDGYGIVHESKFPQLESFMERAFSDNEYQNWPIISLLFSPALYFWILVISTAVFAKTKEYKFLSITGFLWGIYITILLGPCVVIRYLYPLVVSSPLLLCMMRISVRNQLHSIHSQRH